MLQVLYSITMVIYLRTQLLKLSYACEKHRHEFNPIWSLILYKLTPFNVMVAYNEKSIFKVEISIMTNRYFVLHFTDIKMKI